jgi:hypothetical protein
MAKLITFEILIKKEVEKDWANEITRKYPVHADWLFEIEKKQLIYKYEPSSKLNIEAYKKFHIDFLKKKYKADKVTVILEK